MSRINKIAATKLFLLFLLIIVPLCILTNLSFFRQKKEESLTFTSDIAPTADYFTEKTFVFILPLTTRQKACEQTVASILNQKYEQYRIIFLETAKTKTCGDHLLQLATKRNKRNHISRYMLKEGTLLFVGYQNAVETLKDDDVIVQLNMHDWLAHDDVLTKLNHTYSTSTEVWLVYSQYLEYPSYKKGNMKPYLKRMLRNRTVNKIPYLSSHFKTYYASLFKQYCRHKHPLPQKTIEESLNLSLLPMVETSKNHIRYMEEILYIHSTK